MALVGMFEDQYGVTHDNAYAKISEIHYNSLTKLVSFVVAIFHDKAARQAVKVPVAVKYYEVLDEKFEEYFSDEVLSQQDKSIIGQAYAYIKAETGDFDGWQDA